VPTCGGYGHRRRLHHGDALARTPHAPKLATLIAARCASADSIDDLDVVRRVKEAR
jgi:hypothetical protein